MGNRSQATKGDMIPMPDLDYPLIIAALMLLGLGIVMVASASLHRVEAAPFYFVIRHLIAIGIGLTAALVISQIPIEVWERSGIMLYLFGLFLLVLVLVPGIGREVNNATRWIPLGPFTLQSSEFMKFFMVIYVGGYLVRRQMEVRHTLWGVAKPAILLGIASFLIIQQPDYGTTVLLIAVALGMLFMGGVPIWQFLLLILISGLSMVSLAIFEPYRMQRLVTFMDPWADVQDSGYQLVQALIAFGRGEWLGVGLGSGIQKQFHLPEAHNDFLLAVIGEELGLVGVLLVIAIFGVIIWRAMRIGAMAERCQQHFASYIAQGFGLYIGLQAFINIGVNIGLLPTKGLTLPFMSYGGNSIIVACMAIAILVRIDYEVRKEDPMAAAGRVRWARA
jgi:cell division protein FtsW